jgi:hypothetical protein
MGTCGDTGDMVHLANRWSQSETKDISGGTGALLNALAPFSTPPDARKSKMAANFAFFAFPRVLWHFGARKTSLLSQNSMPDAPALFSTTPRNIFAHSHPTRAQTLFLKSPAKGKLRQSTSPPQSGPPLPPPGRRANDMCRHRVQSTLDSRKKNPQQLSTLVPPIFWL